MNFDERLDRLEALPEIDETSTRIMRAYRPNGALGWQLSLFRHTATHTGTVYFFGATIHEALLSAEKELLKR